MKLEKYVVVDEFVEHSKKNRQILMCYMLCGIANELNRIATVLKTGGRKK